MDNTAPLHKNPCDKDERTLALADNMAALMQQLSSMETFIKRRFDEISMEINATSQQIDMSEDGMAKRFGEILGAMNAISFSGDGSTPANTGVELEAVIAETQKAANTILDCTDRMSALLHAANEAAWTNADDRARILDTLAEDLQNIIIACSFQDIAGQRIRKTLESIGDIEDRISSTLESMGIGPQSLQVAVAAGAGDKIRSGSTQDEIDALFGN